MRLKSGEFNFYTQSLLICVDLLLKFQCINQTKEYRSKTIKLIHKLLQDFMCQYIAITLMRCFFPLPKAVGIAENNHVYFALFTFSLSNLISQYYNLYTNLQPPRPNPCDPVYYL